MRMHSLLSLALMPAALVAQTPATDYMTVFNTQSPAIDALVKDYKYPEALAKGLSLLPKTVPAFDKTTAITAQKSSANYSGLTRLYITVGQAAILAGEWEKALELFTTAKTCAQVNVDTCTTLFTPVIASWQKAEADGKKYMADNAERVKTLKAKPGRTAAEEKDYQEFLDKDQAWRQATKGTKQFNELGKWLQEHVAKAQELEAKAPTGQEQQELQAYEVAVNNVAQAPKVYKSLQEECINGAKDELANAEGKIAAIQKTLKVEADEHATKLANFPYKVAGKLVKDTSGPRFEEKKAKYFEAALNNKENYASREKKIDKLSFLYRMRHNCLGTPVLAKVDEIIARVNADQDPLPAKPAKGKGGKKAK